MPDTKKSQELPMLYRIRHGRHKRAEIWIVKWDSIHAVETRFEGEWLIRIWYAGGWKQFSENNPDALALFELWNNQCILPEGL